MINFDKISFRPNAQEKAFLEKANEKYRCRTITNLMHKLLAEFMAMSATELKTTLATTSENNRDRKLVLKDTRLEAVSTIQNADNKQLTIEQMNPYLDAFREVFWLEEARQKLERLRWFSK